MTTTTLSTRYIAIYVADNGDMYHRLLNAISPKALPVIDMGFVIGKLRLVSIMDNDSAMGLRMQTPMI